MRPVRRKAVAIGGIASILMGAVLLIAPPSAGAAPTPTMNPGGLTNASCSDLGYEFEARFNGSGDPGDSGQVSGDDLVVNWVFENDGTISFTVDATSLYDVSAAIVKQASDQSGGGVNVYEYDPPVSSDTGLVDPRGDRQFSHLAFCAETPPEDEEASLTVVKKLTDPQDPGTFAFTLDNANFDNNPLGHGDSKSFTPLDPGTYTVAETSGEGYDLDSIVCVDDDDESETPLGAPDVTVDLANEKVDVTLADGDSVTCTFTNDPVDTPPALGSLSVDKVVTGTAKPVAGTTFPFTVDCGDVDLNGDDDGTDASFDLTDTDAAKVFADLPVGTTCTVTETNTRNATSTTIKVDNAAATAGPSVSGVTINEDATRAVVVTNDFTPTPPPPPTPPPTPTTTPPAEDASLTIVKAVTGDIPDEWSADFEGTEPSLGTFTLSGTDDVITDEITFDDLEAGTYSVVETDSGLASLTGIVCDEGVDPTLDLGNGSLSIALDEGDDVTCTFTNDFPEVLPDVVTPPVAEPTPAAPPAPVAKPTEVMGETVTRTLPRTGSSTGHLATAGIALMIFGGILVGGSRRLQMG